MKAIVFEEYGAPEVLQLKEVEKPAPRRDEVLIRVRAVSVTYGDLIVRNLKELPRERFNMPDFMFPIIRLMFGYHRPKKNILGSEFSGVVESIGNQVKNFKPGDEVMGYTEANLGANAEYICVSAKGVLALKPTNLTFEEAATLPYGAQTALNILRKVDIESPQTAGKNIFIHGASGSIGSYAVQIAKAYGAEVTGSCSSARVDYVRSLGADHIIDYTREDFTKNGQRYDLILDVLGKKRFCEVKDSLSARGVHLLGSFKGSALGAVLSSKFSGGPRSMLGMTTASPADLQFLKELAEAKKIRPIIDRVFPLEEAAAAHRYLEEHRQQGFVILKLDDA